MMKVWNQVLELLSDGAWHQVKDLQEKLGLNDFKIKLLANFLKSYDFCILTRALAEPGITGDLKEIKLRSKVLKFMEELDRIEGR